MLNKKVLQYRFEKLAMRLFGLFREFEPEKSGNMKKEATSLVFSDAFEARITINPDKAPYSVYTVINWGLTSPVIRRAKNPAWIGRRSFLYNKDGTPKDNPNEDWIQKTVDALMRDILCNGYIILNGIIKKGRI